MSRRKNKTVVPTDADRERAWRIWDVDGDGKLDYTEVERAMRLSFSNRGWSSGLSDLALDLPKEEPLLRRAFAATDNGDGTISRPEFRILLEYIVYFCNLQDKFEQLDEDNSGELSVDEFVDGVVKLQLRGRTGQLISASKAMQEFYRIDTDRSGNVSFEEFCVWCVQTEIGKPPKKNVERSETPENIRVAVSRRSYWRTRCACLC